MNTIDVTTITDVKFFDGNAYPSTDVNIKPDGGNNLSGQMNKLFKARYVRVRDEWVEVVLGQGLNDDTGIGTNTQYFNIKDGTENNNGNVGDPETVSYLQIWGFYFPEGEYLFDNVILRDKIFILGSGPKTVFKSFQLKTWMDNGTQITKAQFAGVNPIFTMSSGDPLKSVILENVTIEDAKGIKLTTEEVTFRNNRFYNMVAAGIGDFSRSHHLLIEDNYLGFRPNAEINGIIRWEQLHDPNNPTLGILQRDVTKACSGVGIYAEASGGLGQSKITIRNNYIESSGDNGISVRGLAADVATSFEASGISHIKIQNNRIYRVGKAGIKLTYETGRINYHKVLPFGQVFCKVENNDIREWGLYKPEAAISCDNDSFYYAALPDFAFPSEESDEYAADIPLQEILLPYMAEEPSDGEEFGYNEYGDDPLPVLEGYYASYSTGLVIKGNLIMGSGRAFPGEGDINEAYGITARKWKNLCIANNIITGTPIYNQFNTHYPSGSTTRSGIQLNSCADFAITGNVVTNSAYVYLVLENGEANDTRGAIKLIGCTMGTIHGNTLKNPGSKWDPEHGSGGQSQGVVLWNSRFCNINGNVMACYNPKHMVGTNINQAQIIGSTMEFAVKEMGNDTNIFVRCANNIISNNMVFNAINAVSLDYSLLDKLVVGQAKDPYYSFLPDSVAI